MKNLTLRLAKPMTLAALCMAVSIAPTQAGSHAGSMKMGSGAGMANTQALNMNRTSSLSAMKAAPAFKTQQISHSVGNLSTGQLSNAGKNFKTGQFTNVTKNLNSSQLGGSQISQGLKGKGIGLGQVGAGSLNNADSKTKLLKGNLPFNSLKKNNVDLAKNVDLKKNLDLSKNLDLKKNLDLSKKLDLKKDLNLSKKIDLKKGFDLKKDLHIVDPAHCVDPHHCDFHCIHWDIDYCQPFFYTTCWHPETANYVVWVNRNNTWVSETYTDLAPLADTTPLDQIAVAEPVPYEYEEEMADGTVVKRTGTWWIAADGQPHGQETWSTVITGPEVAQAGQADEVALPEVAALPPAQ